MHSYLGKACDDMERRHTFNTMIAASMELTNLLMQAPSATEQDLALLHEGLSILCCVLSPIIPHITHVLWYELGYKKALVEVSWPEIDSEALIQKTVSLVLQVNGKLRGQIEVAADADAKSIEALVLSNEQILRHTEGKTIKKVIVVPKRLVNVVV